MTGLEGDSAATSSSAFFRLAAAKTTGDCASAGPETAISSRAKDAKRRMNFSDMVNKLYRTGAVAATRFLDQFLLQRGEIGGDGPGGGVLHAAEALEHFFTERGQACAAALRAAPGGGDQRRAEFRVHLGHQPPGARIAHFHEAAGGRDGAGVADALQQVRLAGTESHALAKGDAQARAKGLIAVTHRRPRRGRGRAPLRRRIPGR